MSEAQSRERLEAHYRIEKELAARLRSASAAERCALYTEVYDEFFRRVPDHPQLTRKASPEETRAYVADQFRMIGDVLRDDTEYLEVGPGDCAFAFSVAARVAQVNVVDVSREITERDDVPDNCRVIISDGSSIPVPPGSIDVAYSNQLMEHLHPDDARAQLANLYAALKPGGCYMCITPNRLNGPHDVSRFFDDVATGFHLKEYTVAELSDLFSAVGFTHLRCRVGAKGHYSDIGPWLPRFVERVLGALPANARRAVADLAPVRALLNIRIIGYK
jgi:SAM-dependent methyltransferase